MTAATITEVTAPASLDADEAWPLLGLVDLTHDVEVDVWGHDEMNPSLLDHFISLLDQRHALSPKYVATLPDEPRRVVGAAQLHLPTEGNTHLAEIDIQVHPDFRRAGIGTQLLAVAEERAIAEGRAQLLAGTNHGAEARKGDPRALVPPTGSGRVPGEDPGALFALARGYTLEQAERHSSLDLPVPKSRLRRLHDEARAKVGEKYRTLTWVDTVPAQWREEFIRLAARMSTDLPRGDIEFVETPWDLDRLAAAEERMLAAGRGRLITAVEHVHSGRLAGYTMIERSGALPTIGYQEDTIVDPKHRGHRLGLFLKTTNLFQLAMKWPSIKRLHTWNAEENNHMLDINVQLGFAPSGVFGLWRRVDRE